MQQRLEQSDIALKFWRKPTNFHMTIKVISQLAPFLQGTNYSKLTFNGNLYLLC